MFRISVAVLIWASLAMTGFAEPIQDIEPPDVVSLVIEPSHVDCSLSDQLAIMRWEVTDNLSGIDATTHVRLESPSGANDGNAAKTILLGVGIAGSPQAGTYEMQFIMPRYSEIGTWTVSRLWAWDVTGNLRRHVSSLPDYFAEQGIALPTITVGTTPEPTSAVLVVIAAVCLLFIRPRRARARLVA